MVDWETLQKSGNEQPRCEVKLELDEGGHSCSLGFNSLG